MNIGNICKSAVPEVFEHALQQVLKNISDPNTDAKQKRTIVLKFVFKPSDSREVGDVTFFLRREIGVDQGCERQLFPDKARQRRARICARSKARRSFQGRASGHAQSSIKRYNPKRRCSRYGRVGAGIQHDTLEMLESVRNVLEDIRQELRNLNNKQMLQCDVRRDIRAIATEARAAAKVRKAKESKAK
jgi:hypothetical protein